MSRFKPSKHSSILEITGSKSDLLAGKRIVIGITGASGMLYPKHRNWNDWKCGSIRNSKLSTIINEKWC